MTARSLTLPHEAAKRLFSSSLLIVARDVKVGSYEVHDALVARRNRRRTERSEAKIATIHVSDVQAVALMDLDLRRVRAAGFKTQRDFYEDWLERHGLIESALQVSVCRFAFEEQPRMLHAKLHRGYTTNPAEAARDEPSALSSSELKLLTGRARARFEREQRQELLRRQVRALNARIRDAARRGDVEAFRVAERDLARLRAMAEAA